MSDELRGRRQRRLSDAERTLWNEVTRDIVRMCPRVASDSPTELAAEPAPQPTAVKTSASSRAPSPAAPPAERLQGPPPLAPLGRRMRARIARGSHAIGGRLDLHGLSQARAHDALFGFLHAAQDRGTRLVLVITGKGAPGEEAGHGRGVLKRQVPHWLRLPAFRDLVVGFEPAHPSHGGEGALYVRVRRRKAP